MVRIFASVINYNNPKDTLECLKSLEKIKKKDIELDVCIVDNSSAKPFELDSSYFRTFSSSLIRNTENLGFSGGHNVAIRKAMDSNADYLLILNNDTRSEQNLLVKLLECIQQADDIGITVPKIYFENGYEYHKNRYKNIELGKILWYAGGFMDWENVIGMNRGVDEVDTGQYDDYFETELATGCCMLIKKEVFKKIGPLDERYFLYYEDTDFSMRTKKAGYKIIFQPESILWHKNAGSSGGSGSELQDYFISRNRLIFGMSYAPLTAKFALFRESLKLFYSGRKWQKKGVKDFYLRNFGKGGYSFGR